MKSSQAKSSSSFRAKTIRVDKMRGRKTSSQRWLHRHLNDPYVQQAKAVGYRSRAAYKILEIHEKYKVFKPGQMVIDLGAAPGGWSQVVTQFIASPTNPGRVVAIDILPIESLTGVQCIQGDFLDPHTQQQLELLTGQKADVILSDMAAPTIGHSTTDQLRTRVLAEAAFSFAQKNLKTNGTFIAKVFAGGTQQELLMQLKQAFKRVKHFKPPASRQESPEVYVICQEFQG